MRRPFVISTAALALALLPAAVFAQTPPAQQPPAQQPPAQGTPAQPAQQAPAAPAQPAEPKLGFTTPSGLLLVQIKPDQTAAFEELASKLKAALETTTDPALKAQGSAWHFFKSSEAMGGNALYVIVVNPATAGTEYNPIDVLFKTMTPEQQRAPETQEMFKRFASAFAGVNKLNLTPVAGGM
jgi:hypothetical protein